MNPVEFKDLPGLVGQEVGVSDWLEITQDRLGDALRDRQMLSGEVVNLQQSQQSLLRLLEKQGHSPIPQDSVLRREGDDG